MQTGLPQQGAQARRRWTGLQRSPLRVCALEDARRLLVASDDQRRDALSTTRQDRYPKAKLSRPLSAWCIDEAATQAVQLGHHEAVGLICWRPCEPPIT